MESHVLTRIDGGVAIVTLNRPEKRNALSIELRLELAGALNRLSADEAVCVLVLTGAGSAFCSGMDTSQFGGDAANRTALVESTEALFGALAAVQVPLIAAVNGPALAGGFALAAACDVRLAGPDASFGTPEIRLGIPASYAALLRTVPDHVARELAFTGRTVGADEALALGIVREIAVDVVARATAMATAMAAYGRKVLVATKGIVAAGNGDAARAREAELEVFRRAMLRPE